MTRHRDQGLAFQRANGGTLAIGPDAANVIDRYRQHNPKGHEAGGVLLGRLVLERPDAIVDAVTEPSMADRRTRFAFWRARRPTQDSIDTAWEKSIGTKNYLGEWHTHPEDHPTPSPTDIKNWKRLAKSATFEQDSLFFVIAGRVATLAWEVARGGHSVEVLQLLDHDSTDAH